MKAKNIFIICLLTAIAVASAFTAFAGDRIYIMGSHASSGGPSRAPKAPAVEVELEDDVISVCFLNNLGDITVTVTSETGEVVYQSIEASDYGVTVDIDLHELEGGHYTITFTNDGSLFLYGGFEL